MENLIVPIINVTHTLPQEWRYISEGGATIVFSYTGEHPDFNGTVLRLRKTPFSNESVRVPVSAEAEGISQTSQVNRENYSEPDDPMIDFQHTVIERLIPTEHLPRLMPVRVEYAWLQSLAERCHSERPQDRTQKDHIDVARTKAVIATDLVGGDGLTVEIKASLV